MIETALGGPEPPDRAEEMGMVLPPDVLREGGYQNLWEVLCGGGAVCAAIWVGFMCCHTPNYAGAGNLP